MIRGASMDKKKVSVVVPVYNAEAYLAECMESICAQTWENIEIICVDDGSSDGSGEILESFGRKDKRIRLLKQAHQYRRAMRILPSVKAGGWTREPEKNIPWQVH